MANSFQLNEEDASTLKKRQAKKKSGLNGMLINWGLAKTESQANLYLVALAIICIGVIIYQNRSLIF